MSGECFRDLPAIAPQRIWEGVEGRAVYGDQMTLAVVELAPGSDIPEHSHANEQLGLLLEGSLTFRVGTETRTLAVGATWRIAAHEPHEVHVGDTGAVVIEAFAPPRDDWQALEHRERTTPRWPRS